MSSPIVRAGEIKLIVELRGKYKGQSCVVYADGRKEILPNKRADALAKELAKLDDAAHKLREHREHGLDPRNPIPMRLDPMLRKK